MRVLLIGDYPPPHGGIAVHVHQLHAHLRGRGVEVKVLDIGKGQRASPDVLPVRTARQLLAQLLARAREGWTIHLHTSGNNAKAWALIALIGAVPGSAKVVTLHSGLLPSFLEGHPRLAPLARAALSGFDAIVSVSEPIDRAVGRLGVAEVRRSVLPAFLSGQIRAGDPPDALEAIRARRRPLLVMAAHPSEVYGVAEMFQALRRFISRHPQAGLAVFGPGTDSPAFLERARQAGVADWLEPLGELEHGAALAVIAAADVFVRPTRADGDALSVREALALGTPCVASDVTVRPEGTISCRCSDPEALARGLEEALVSGRPFLRGPDAGAALESLYSALGGEREVEGFDGEGVRDATERGTRVGGTCAARSRSGGLFE